MDITLLQIVAWLIRSSNEMVPNFIEEIVGIKRPDAMISGAAEDKPTMILCTYISDSSDCIRKYCSYS
jgi:hypothetical protein